MSRGGRGGGRGGRGGKPSVFTPQLLGHLDFGDIIAQSKAGTGILYPPMEVPNTDYPSETESRIAKKYNEMTSEMKFSPYWLDAPVKASTDIERYSDRFKLVRSSASGTPTPAFASLHTKRKLDKELLPTAAFEAIFERKKRTRAVDSGSRKKLKSAKDLVEGDDKEEKDEDSEDELEEEVDELEDEEWEDENDYAENYFDNGEDDGGEGGDALGGGGDEGGGDFD
ncbi:DNA-directed RNA polymerase III subunit RPC7, partial [Phenoliferia sp. Uapishka_3]